MRFSPDHKKISFLTEENGRIFLKIFDVGGNLLFAYDFPLSVLIWEGEEFAAWSADSSMVAYVDYTHEKISDCVYNASLIVHNLNSREKKAYEGGRLDICYQPADGEYYYPLPYIEGWLADNYSIIWRKSRDEILILDTETGENRDLPIYGFQFGGISAR